LEFKLQYGDFSRKTGWETVRIWPENTEKAGSLPMTARFRCYKDNTFSCGKQIVLKRGGRRKTRETATSTHLI